jgi:TolB-like protein
MQEINLSQYDSDVTLEFELYASDGTFVVESGTTAVFRGSKPDKNGISVAATLNSSQDPETGRYVYVVSVDIIPQMTAVAGKSMYELSLQKNGEELNTANFILDIERAPLDADTLPSESVIRELVDVIDKADEIIAAAETVTTAIDDTLTQQGKAADAKAVGDALGTLITFTDPNNNGNVVVTVGGGS